MARAGGALGRFQALKRLPAQRLRGVSPFSSVRFGSVRFDSIRFDSIRPL